MVQDPRHACHPCVGQNADVDGKTDCDSCRRKSGQGKSEEEAKEWVRKYLEAVESYEKRVNAAPAVSLEEFMFGGDKAAYPTEEELAAMPKEE